MTQKSKIVAGLLAIFLGCYGAQHFYLGDNKKAIIYLVVSLATCGLGAVVIQVLSYIEAYKIFTDPSFTDANGNTLAD